MMIKSITVYLCFKTEMEKFSIYFCKKEKLKIKFHRASMSY